MSEQESFESRVVEEHRQLGPLFAGVAEALESGTSQSVREAIGHLRSVLEAHLAQEDQIYYPALSRLYPWTGASLARFSEFHRRFLDEFEAWQRTVENEASTSASEEFRSFRENFARHEVHEEEFLRQVTSAAGGSHKAPFL